MRLRRSALPLPRYTVRRRLKSGGFGHFFQVPTWARKKGCTIGNEALGVDYDRAVLRAEKILLPLDADGGLAHTPWHRVRGSTGTCRGAVSCDLRLALLAGWWAWLPWLSGSDS